MTIQRVRHRSEGKVDEVHVLLASLARSGTPEDAVALFETICRFDDARVIAECRRRISMPGPLALRRRAAITLAERDPAEARRFLRAWLHQDRDAETAGLAALALSRLPDLSDGDRIRIASAVSDQDLPVPMLDRYTAVQWFAELRGPFAEGARRRLMEQEELAYEALARRWEHLLPGERRWLLEWGTRSHPMEAVGLLKRALVEKDDELKLLALELIPGLGSAAAWFAPLLTQLTDCSVPATPPG